uniref:Uncharacterized protein n=1 Tax=Romanomermis culicivorax TaxID=13658 RepID=A0A915IRA1_ROMCU
MRTEDQTQKFTPIRKTNNAIEMKKTFPGPASSVSSASNPLPPGGTSLKIPKTSNEFSSNWKSILTVVKQSDQQAKVKRSSLWKDGSTKKTKKAKLQSKSVEASCSVRETRRSVNECCGSESLPKASTNSEIPAKSNNETSST